MEWSVPWQTADNDGGNDPMSAIHAMECTVHQEPDITLPTTCGLWIYEVGERFWAALESGAAGLGRDTLS